MTGLGTPRVHLRRTDSTNLRARALAERGAPHGTLVTAAEQTAGRGRQGRTWTAPAGRALLCSLVLREPPRLLSLLAGVAVAETVDMAGHAQDRPARVKWPNDVLVGGRKVAGILAEGRPTERWAVLGIGVNVAVRLDDLPASLRDSAGTLGLDPPDLERVLASLLDRLDAWLVASEHAALAAIRTRDALLDQPVGWSGGEGVGAGIDDDGRLVVALAGHERARVALDAGEVHLTGG